MQVSWLHTPLLLCARFWNRCTSVLEPGFIGKALMTSDVNLFKEGCDTCWTGKFLTCMCRLGLADGKSVSMLKRLRTSDILCLRFPEGEVKGAFLKVLQGACCATGIVMHILQTVARSKLKT